MTDLGANYQNKHVHFKVWAPFQSSLKVVIDDLPPIEMKKDGKDYFHAEASNIHAGQTYTYILENGQRRSDPVSRYLPLGTKGPSSIIDPHAFSWTDQTWKKPPLKDLIFYECHVGTFTQNGTFADLITKIDYLKDLGINCLEIMPVAQFSGKFGWGYDGVSLYAPHNTYGTPDDLKRLINACHEKEIAVCLDVVYNHLGPEDCYLSDFGPYWTNSYQTPWGMALNLDRKYSDEVRNYLIQNALYWIEEYHIDLLRLDALHALYDFSATAFLQELSEAARDKAYLIGESDLNDHRLITNYHLSGLWNEDFHHALHVTLTHEKRNYYQDFQGLDDLKTIFKKNLVYDGKFSIYRKRRHGNSFANIPAEKLVVFSQNHDQIGNREKSDRLHLSLDLEKVTATLLILGPYLPLLFMGQEYGETHPFEYFVDYENPALLQKIKEGRNKEYGAQSEPDQAAFLRSKLSWNQNQELYTFYQKLIAFRKSHPIFRHLEKKDIELLSSDEPYLSFKYVNELAILCYFGSSALEVSLPFPYILFHTSQSQLGNSSRITLNGPTAVITSPHLPSVNP